MTRRKSAPDRQPLLGAIRPGVFALAITPPPGGKFIDRAECDMKPIYPAFFPARTGIHTTRCTPDPDSEGETLAPAIAELKK